ncbi:MAG: hypothetical protein DYG99_05810 [Bacteroidetes bacterium CHB5]|nr:hypothetical protein [Bacteroidetes bacterium CHB5]
MKLLLPTATSIFFWLFSENGQAQLINDIKHEAFGDKVVITYLLNGVSANQYLDVSLYFSQDDFKNPLLHVHGSGAGNEVEGNGQKTIIWDVLKDKPELTGSVQFEIRALVYSKQMASKSVGKDIVVISIEDRKNETYASISSALSNFIITLKDLVISFQHMTPAVFEGDVLPMRNVTNAVLKYNDAFNRLNHERMGYEKQVMSLWQNEALTIDVRYLFDYALGELHSANVLELNSSLNTINDISSGKIIGRKNQKEAKDKVFSDIYHNTTQLEKRVLELERRANRILYTLSEK